MNNNEFSFESIFAAGMGIPTDNRVEAQSEERFDGNFDTVFAEISRSEEDINFLETYGSLENYNTKAKLDMLNKINKAYGKCNRGIENYCRSLEAETEGTSAVKEEEKTTEAPKDTTKKKNWLVNVLTAIGRFFKFIWTSIVNFFKDMVSKIKTFFAKQKAKKEMKNAAAEKTTAPTTTAPTTTAPTTTAPTNTAQNSFNAMTPEMQKQIEKAFDSLYGNVSKFIPMVNKVSQKNDEAVKDLDKIAKDTDGKSNGELFNAVYDNLLVCSSCVKILSQVGKAILKAAQFIASNATNIKKLGDSKFNQFMNIYSKSSNYICDAYDKIKNHKTGGTKEIRQKFGEDIYEFYNIIVTDMVKPIFGSSLPVVTKTDFTNPSSSGKNMSKIIKDMSNGLSKTITDMDQPVILKKVIAGIFAAEIDDKAFNKK